jgi:hypothetical protein
VPDPELPVAGRIGTTVVAGCPTLEDDVGRVVAGCPTRVGDLEIDTARTSGGGDVVGGDVGGGAAVVLVVVVWVVAVDHHSTTWSTPLSVTGRRPRSVSRNTGGT